jgi:hypothetical protein
MNRTFMARASCHVLWLVVSALGCAGAAPESEPSAPEPAASEPSPELDVAPASSEAPSSSAPSEAAPSAQPAKEPARSLDIEVWAADHGVQANLNVERCEPAQVGDKPDDAIWCFRREELKQSHALIFQSLYVARAQKLMKLIELPVTLALLGSEDSSAPERSLVQLEAVVGDGGKLVTFSETAAASCSQALERAKAEHPDEPKAEKEQRDLISKVCAARGNYRWAAGTLRRAAK